MIDAVTFWRIISDSSKVFYKIPMKQDNEIKICMTIVLFIGNEKRYNYENKRYHKQPAAVNDFHGGWLLCKTVFLYLALSNEIDVILRLRYIIKRY